jgi:hypothetical protein
MRIHGIVVFAISEDRVSNNLDLKSYHPLGSLRFEQIYDSLDDVVILDNKNLPMFLLLPQ